MMTIDQPILQQVPQGASVGLYIHIPFCVQKCAYCDFCSYPIKDKSVLSAYVEEVCRQMRASTGGQRIAVDTIFFGGGTPTRLGMADWEKLFETIQTDFQLLPNAEVTTECNPATVTYEDLVHLKRLGINRLSIGGQSAINQELKLLGRVHDAQAVFHTVSMAQKAGFAHVNLDLMFGIPMQTIASLKDTLDAFVACNPDHISAYALQLEKGTPLERNKNRYVFPDDELTADMYEVVVDHLGQHGYKRYEVSNFAKPGGECRHNLRYWDCQPYMGYGIAAHSLVQNRRFYIASDLQGYLDHTLAYEEEELMDSERLSDEYVALRLRLDEGLARYDVFSRYGIDFQTRYGKNAEQLIRKGLLEKEGDRLRIPYRYVFTGNAILRELLDV